MTKREVSAAVDDAWRAFKRALEPLTSSDMEVPGVCGEWSVKDVLGHISTWESRVTRALLRGGSLPDPPDIDAFNADEQKRRSSLPVAETVIQLDATHRALRDAIEDAPESVFGVGGDLRRQLDEGTVFHYDDHANGIRVWFAGYRRARRDRV